MYNMRTHIMFELKVADRSHADVHVHAQHGKCMRKLIYIYI